MGGQIRRVKFEADHTMVAVRMFDEEACIFLPSRARLKELGFRRGPAAALDDHRNRRLAAQDRQAAGVGGEPAHASPRS
jgi:hypothetical protein